MIRLTNVSFAYEDEPVLDHISLEIKKGESVVFQGDNGCGKSTLLKLLNGLIYPQAGTYEYEGKEISEKSLKDSHFSKKFHQNMGYVFQNSDVQLFCGSVKEEIAFGPIQMGLSDAEVEKRVGDVLQLMGIEKLAGRAPYHLSGGEKKKVALACILSMNPQVLVLDEPLAGLDRKSQSWLTDFLKRLHEAGKTLIISTHNDVLADTLADRIVEMADGKILR